LAKKALGAALREAGLKARNDTINDTAALMVHRGLIVERPGSRGSIILSLAQKAAA
jgi:hypothetical protein